MKEIEQNGDEHRFQEGFLFSEWLNSMNLRSMIMIKQQSLEESRRMKLAI